MNLLQSNISCMVYTLENNHKYTSWMTHNLGFYYPSPGYSQQDHASCPHDYTNLQYSPREGKAPRPNTGLGKVEEGGNLTV